jgi:pyrimidine-nucleoside phosphorylase
VAKLTALTDGGYSPGVLPAWIIEKKRDGQALSDEDIRAFVAGHTAGQIPDYQMAALAMAIYFRGMSFAETAALTDAMMRSGQTVDTSSLARPTADKHSTGGIGDKTSLILAPLAACCGLAVPMISGRGLGITGGTLDKLESIPGYRTDLSIPDFLRVVERCGCSIIGQTAELAPADRKLYALRDVTGTVPSIPLITASIMSKKLAEGARCLALDVKWGRGAFMRERTDAEKLAETLVAVGRRMGRRMGALITDMNQPLGRTVGNALEVVECVEALQGRGPADLVDLTLELTALMLALAGLSRSIAEGRRLAQRKLDSGESWERFLDMVRLHGGDAGSLEKTDRLPQAPLRRDLPSPRAGYVSRVDAEWVGRACVALGAGRRRVEDAVNPAVGITHLVKIGERVEQRTPLLTIHAASEAAVAEALPLLERAFAFSDQFVVTPPAIARRILEEDMRP